MPQRRSVLDAYVRELGRYPVLDADQQRRLASVLRDSTQPEQERERARCRLLESNLRFAFSLARQHQGRGVDLGDLVADANLGLTRAVEHYDPCYGVPFVSYAAWWIRQAIRQGIARQGHPVSVPSRRLRDIARVKRTMHALRGRLGRAPTPDELAAELAVSPSVITALLRVSAGESPLDAGTAIGPESPVTSDDSSAHDALQAALDKLSGQEREIIMLSFGLRNRSVVTNEEIARLLTLSPERIRQIRARALVRLRRGRSGAVLQELWAS